MRYEIAWPGAPRQGRARGVDAVQALLLALQMIGAELFNARPDTIADVRWLDAAGGLGFPLPPSLRSNAIGDDRLL